MSCNCKTSEKILKFHRKYGNQMRLSWKERIHFTMEETIKFVILALVVVFLFPIILIVIVVMIALGKANFDLNNILRFLLRSIEK